MRRLATIAGSFLYSAAGCLGSERAKSEELDMQAASTSADAEDDAPEQNPAPTPAGSLAEQVRESYFGAGIAVPPPAIGSTAPLLRLSRPNRSSGDLARRLSVVLEAMELSLQPSAALAWASAAVDHNRTVGVLEPHYDEPSPGLVVVYDGHLDDLLVVNTAAHDISTRESTDIIPWEDAHRVIRSLIDHGVVDSISSLDRCDVAFVRSGVEGPEGTHEQWVDEVRFEANAQVAGIALMDAGVRVAVTPDGRVSSVRLTGIEVEPLGTVTIGTTAEALQEAFSAHIIDSVPARTESVQVSVRRPVYMLEPEETSGIVAPRYMAVHFIAVRDVHGIIASRSRMTLWSMLSPNPTLEARLPS
jgi:hypothetical protein